MGVLSGSALSGSLQLHGTTAHQASLQFSRNIGEVAISYSKKILLDPGIEPASLASPALAGGFLTTSATWEARGVGAGVVRRGRGTSPDGKGFTELESRCFGFLFLCCCCF